MKWLALLVGLTACSAPNERAELHVYAASSLTDAFQALEAAYEAAHPEVDVRLAFAGSQVLRLQIEHGARADVFASAHAEHLDALQGAGLVDAIEPLARNALVVIVPLDSPLRRWADLPRADRIVVGTEHVPVGRYTRALLNRAPPEIAAAVRARIVSEENNARLVRAKVELGEADAAIVYRTDVSPRVRPVEIPAALAEPVTYRIGSTTASGGDFVEFVRSPAGREIMRRHGFE